MPDTYTPIYTQGHVHAELSTGELEFLRLLAGFDIDDKIAEMDLAGGTPADDDFRELGFMGVELMRIEAELALRAVVH